MLIPKLWYVKVTEENKVILNLWRQSCKSWKSSWRKVIEEDYIVENGAYISERQVKNQYEPYIRVEITFNQFKKHILNAKT